ncbi:oxidoreductase [Rubellimicrobium sp. CFH 75288]|nr:oxidoreductase [Rubellimicrobium sp. CFH 75288]
MLVTPRSLSAGDHPALRPLREAGYRLVRPAPGRMPQRDELMRSLPGCVGWLCGIEPVDAGVIAAADALRIISRNGTGIDNLPLAALAERGIVVRRAEAANARGVAELALLLILAGLRQMVECHEGVRQGQWPRPLGREIETATIGIVGLGAVGSRLADMVLALGASVLAHDPLAPPDRVRHPRLRRTSLEETVAAADAVTLHVPRPPAGEPLMTAAMVARMKPGAVLVNTARAGLVDEGAVLRSLQDGRLRAYAVDAFATEPPPLAPLLLHPRTILTPHLGGLTVESVGRAASVAVANLLEELGRAA